MRPFSMKAPARSNTSMGPTLAQSDRGRMMDEEQRELFEREETERQSKRLEWLTWALFLLTLALVALEVQPRISDAGH